MKKIVLIGIFFCLVFILIFHYVIVYSPHLTTKSALRTNVLWAIRSIDTMKTSRDIARDELSNKAFDTEIQKELEIIKNTGANYVAIDTPYDNEFLPYLTRWVNLARATGLHVWFRGNWSGWEGWFNYPKNITRAEHILKTEEFIVNHPELFKIGDSFTACPECEYGGPGNPLVTRDIEGYKNFLIDEKNAVDKAFKKIGINVYTNWNSINPDVAKEEFDSNISQTLNNQISLDYYFNNNQVYEKGISYFIDKFPDIKIFMSEFGAPIPDINGNMTENEQAEFIDSVFKKFYENNTRVIGINYWVIKGGTTALLNDDDSKRQALDVITNYFSPSVIQGKITDDFNKPLANTVVTAGFLKTKTDINGEYSFTVPKNQKYVVSAGGGSYSYKEREISQSGQAVNYDFVVSPLKPDFWYRIRLFIKNLR